MPEFTYPSLNSDQGTQTGNTLRNAANAAANAVCGLYANAPSGLLPSLGDPLGVGAFTQGLLDDLCRPRNQVPPDPVLPFQGGQCPVAYDVSYVWQGGSNTGGSGTTRVIGKVGKVTVALQTEAGQFKYYRADFPHANGTFNIVSGGFGLDEGKQPITASITSVVRADGQPDTCGNPAPVYPTREPVPSDYTPLPVPIKTPSGIVNIPITIIPTLVKPELNFRPEFNVEVGDLNINFNLDGVDISFKPTFNFPPSGKPGNDQPFPAIDPRPNPPTSTPTRSPSVKCPDVDFTPILQRLKKLEECACEGEFTVQQQVYGKAKGNVIQLPERSFYVSLALELGSGLRYQASEGIAPDLHYAGWISFGYGTKFGERLRVDFASSGFFIPKGATHFAYSLVFNTSAVPTVLYRVPIIPT